mgnify:CR=1 FL=1|jgi:hypothetical protein
MKSETYEISKVDDDYLQMAAQAVAKAFEVDADDILGRRRTEPLVFARQTAYWLIKIGMGYTYCKVGRMFDRDHGGIMHGIKRVKEVLELDLTGKHANGSWADNIRKSRENFLEYHKVYEEVTMKEAGDVVEVA